MKKIFSFFAAVLFAGGMMADNYSLVTDASTLANGDEIIIANVDADHAISTTQNTNNRAAAEVTLDNGVIVPGADVQIIKLVADGTNFMLQTGDDAYLYAASNSSNHLKTSTAATVGDNGKFEITIGAEGVAAVIAQGTNSRNNLRYNPNNGSPMYACYASTSSVAAGLKIFKNVGGVTPPAETKPSIAPAVPTQEEANVMGIYCNHYTVNNANFIISGWAQGYETLDLSGTKAAYWSGYTWECIIDPAHQEEAHDYSAFEKLHFDIWAPAAAKIKFNAEAISGGNYKDGPVVDLVKGWNRFDVALAEWPENYDFKNFKCFTVDQYKTPEGESFEGNPLAIANVYFWKAPVIEPITCADVYNLAKDAKVDLLNDVTVTYVSGKNVWVKDATASMLLYLSADATWKAGDVLSGVAGTVDIYKGLYEVKPSADQVAAVTATAGEVPAPIELTAAPVAADMNKYVVLKKVTVSAATFPSNQNMDATIGDGTFVLRNNFNADVAFDTSKEYDITGVVAVYNATVQVYFINAEVSAPTAIDNATVAGKVQKVVRDGQLYIIRDGVMFNANGVAVK